VAHWRVRPKGGKYAFAVMAKAPRSGEVKTSSSFTIRAEEA